MTTIKHIQNTPPAGGDGGFTSPNSRGYYGKFGGAYIPEMLHRNVEELRSKYVDIIYEESFQKEFRELLRDYAGRPTPLYLANRLSEKYGTKIHVKREDLCHTGAHYIIGSVVGPHPYPDMVARFQSVISEEIRWQLKEKTGSELPSHVLACVGGGSNAAGAFYHFLDEPSVKLIAVEAAGLGLESGYSAATTVLGKPGILHGSKSLVMQTEDGQVVEPHSISAGLDYPGIGPMHANLFETGRAKFLTATDEEALQAAFNLTKMEGIIPALASAPALAALQQLK